MTNLQIQTQDPRQQLLFKLPDNITHIEEEWRRLSVNGWDQQRAKELYVFTQQQAKKYEQLDLFQISETLFLFEIYLGSFIDSEQHPSHEQMEDATQLLNMLQHPGENFAPLETTDYQVEDNINLLSQAPQHGQSYKSAVINRDPVQTDHSTSVAKKTGDNQVIVHMESPEIIEHSAESGCGIQIQEALDDFIAKLFKPDHLITNITNQIKHQRGLPPQSNHPVKADTKSQIELNRGHVQVASNGLITQNQLLAKLTKIISGKPTDDYSSGFIHFEVGNLKQLRETIGYRNSDDLMSAVSEHIIEHKKQEDIVAKSDDAVFAIFVRRTNRSTVKAFADLLLNTIKESPFNIDGLHINPICNIGLRSFDAQSPDISTLISESKQASEQAKKEGGNRVIEHIDLPEIIEYTVKRDLDAQLYDALNESFYTTVRHFKKQEDGSEIKQLALALLSDDGSLHSETEFLSEAREAGLVENIDRLAIHQAFSLLDNNYHQDKTSTVLIQQNSESLIDKEYISWLSERLYTRLMAGSGLILGFNLADLANNPENAKRKIEAFQKMGIAIAILHFKPSGSALKILRLVGAEYVVMSKQYVDLDQTSVEQFIRDAHAYHAQVIIPYISSSHWLQIADYCQKKSTMSVS